MFVACVLPLAFMAPPAESPESGPPVEVDVSEPTVQTEAAAPPNSPPEIPRLFETLQRFRPTEVAFHTNRRGTVTIIPGLQVRNQVGWVSPLTIDRFGNEYDEGVFTSGRVRVNPTLRLGKKQNVDIVLNVDFANGRWAPQTPSGQLIAEIDEPPAGSVAEGIPPIPLDMRVVDFRELYVEWTSRVGQLRVGQMGFTWGEGILANNGNVADRFGDMRFGGDGVGKIYERIMFATRPFAPLGGVGENFVVALGGDLVFRDDRVNLVESCSQPNPRNGEPRCDLAGQAFVAIRYEKPNDPGNWVGGYAVYRNQRNGDDGDVYPDDGDLEVGVGDIAGQGTLELRPNLQLLGGFEGVMIGGRTNQAYNENGDHQVLQGGAVVRGYVGDHERWLAGFDAGYASGDSNPSDNALTGFTFDTTHQVGLVLFQQVRGWRTARTELLATDGDLTGEALNGTQFMPSRGAVTNALYVHPKAKWAYKERLEIWGGPLIAMAASPYADPYTTRLNGGDPTNSVGGSGDKRYYGTELDLGIRGRIDVQRVWFQLGLQGGLLLPGAGLANAAGQTDGVVAAMWLRSEIRY